MVLIIKKHFALSPFLSSGNLSWKQKNIDKGRKEKSSGPKRDPPKTINREETKKQIFHLTVLKEMADMKSS